jgi:hypothetical protein
MLSLFEKTTKLFVRPPQAAAPKESNDGRELDRPRVDYVTQSNGEQLSKDEMFGPNGHSDETTIKNVPSCLPPLIRDGGRHEQECVSQRKYPAIPA